MSRINTSDGQPDRGKESERSMRLLKPRTLGGEQTRTALLALLPSLIVFCVFTVYPIFHSLYLSFFNVGLVAAQGRYVGFNNYLNLVKNPTFRKAVRNTITYTIGVVPVEMLCSLIVAVLLNTKLKLQSFFRTAFFTPVVTSMVAVAIVWSWMLEPNFGLVNSILHKLGIQGPGWLTTPQWAMVSVILLSIWKNLGYNMVIFLAGLQDIPAEVYESAAIDGVTPWKNFWYITLPLLKAPLGFATIMSVIKSMQAFSQIYVMTGGGPANSTLVVVYYLYQQAFEFYRTGYASAVAWVLFAVILAFTLIQNRLFKLDV